MRSMAAMAGVVIVGSLAAAVFQSGPVGGQESGPGTGLPNKPLAEPSLIRAAGTGSQEITKETKQMRDLLRADTGLEERIRQAAKEYAAADEGEAREALKKTISALLTEQFLIRQKRREHEIAQIEERVKRLRDALQKRAESQQDIVNRRLNDLLSDAKGLGWGDPPSGF